MIQNQRQYRVTKGQVSRLKAALTAATGTKAKMPTRVYKAMVKGIESQIEELREELRKYEALKEASALHLGSAEGLPELLVQARVARGYTQSDLADRLRVKPQQIQKYEATGYRSASLARVIDVMKALDLQLETDVHLTK